MLRCNFNFSFLHCSTISPILFDFSESQRPFDEFCTVLCLFKTAKSEISAGVGLGHYSKFGYPRFKKNLDCGSHLDLYADLLTNNQINGASVTEDRSMSPLLECLSRHEHSYKSRCLLVALAL